MKIKWRQKIKPLYLEPRDTIELVYKDGFSEQTVLKRPIGCKVCVNEAVVFDIEKGDFADVIEGIAGAFVNKNEDG